MPPRVHPLLLLSLFLNTTEGLSSRASPPAAKRPRAADGAAAAAYDNMLDKAISSCYEDRRRKQRERSGGKNLTNWVKENTRIDYSSETTPVDGCVVAASSGYASTSVIFYRHEGSRTLRMLFLPCFDGTLYRGNSEGAIHARNKEEGKEWYISHDPVEKLGILMPPLDKAGCLAATITLLEELGVVTVKADTSPFDLLQRGLCDMFSSESSSVEHKRDIPSTVASPAVALVVAYCTEGLLSTAAGGNGPLTPQDVNWAERDGVLEKALSSLEGLRLRQVALYGGEEFKTWVKEGTRISYVEEGPPGGACEVSGKTGSSTTISFHRPEDTKVLGATTLACSDGTVYKGDLDGEIEAENGKTGRKWHLARDPLKKLDILMPSLNTERCGSATMFILNELGVTNKSESAPFKLLHEGLCDLFHRASEAS
ncbi:hypothetical protein FOZ63_031458 [Perkinsus olseni]|uniref:Uncharacterized protein n=1 Tax=Perkinsus olseni TaxID=32597 RepID=A0A7J6QIG3_PEROL|nr:hypothetical protein FOZ62_003730 [Perkinsus olseni]KAF4707859.1 hypothetical protein FOZ63_031458 [Perkinsus olseni]